MKDFLWGVAASFYVAGVCFACTCATSLWCWIPLVAAWLLAALLLFLGLSQADADRRVRNSLELAIDELREQRDAAERELRLLRAVREEGPPLGPTEFIPHDAVQKELP